ncbi:MAG TPA: extracellular solute-binding protein [Chloroflexota bacterium]|nr:extracellular solute-binding protein [Chloroflexota bacterium]
MRTDPSPQRLTRRSFLLTEARIALASSLVVLLSGCTPPATAPIKTASARSSATTTGPSPIPVALSVGNQSSTQQVTWLVPSDPLIDKYAKDAIAPAFQKRYPDTPVQVITPGSNAYPEKLLTMVAGGKAPEVFTTWGGASFFLLFNQKLLADLTPHFQRMKLDPAFILDVLRDEYTVDGQLYGVPWNSNPNFLVYNKTLLEKSGVPLPPTDWNDKSWTIDKLLETATSLTHNTGNPSTAVWGLTMNAGACGSLAWLWGADPFNDQGGPNDSPVYQGKPLTVVYPTRPEVVTAMTWLADLTTKHHVSPTPTDAQALSSYGNPIFSGHIAIAQEAAGWLERQAAVVQPNFELAIAPFPYGPAGVNTDQRQDAAWYLGQKSKHPEAGFNLIVYASQGEGADKLIDIAKDDPPIKGDYFSRWAANVLKIKGFAMTTEQFTAVFNGGINAGFPSPAGRIDNAPQYSDAFDQLMAPVWQGKSTAREGLEQVKAKWEAILKGVRQ